MKSICINLIIILTIVLFSCGQNGQEAILTENLRTELLQSPEGIDMPGPRLSWEIRSNKRGTLQKAYQILVASSKEKLAANEGDLWDSGKIGSDRSVHIAYQGKTLNSQQQCFWKVKVWTMDGESSWSKPGYWSMGLLNKEDWNGKWIGLDQSFEWDSADFKHSRLSARYLRKEFAVTKKVKRATAHIVGLGLYELYINGKKIGDQVLAPAPTDYSKVVKYNSFDVTSFLNDGGNVVGTILGNGRFFTMRQNYKPHKIHTFGYPKMLFQMNIEYTDGTLQSIYSDETWKVTSDGPIRTNNEYDGEEYDANKEMPGWNEVNFDDHQWLKAELVEAPEGKVEAQMNEHMKVVETISPLSIKELSAQSINELGTKTYIIDMGQNMVGWLKLNVKGNKGQKVKLRFSESLKESGELFMDNLRDARVTDIYTLKGEGIESWEPSFIYHGFRYVEITGYPGVPDPNDFEGKAVNDDLKTVGTFETSNETINQVFKNAYWGIKGNYKGMPVDCPQRNERQPWLGDRATGAYGESFIFGHANLYAKWLDDIQQSQTPDGRIPDVAPNFWFYYKDNMTWPGTYLMIADMLYIQYGDERPIIKHYDSMKSWLHYMKENYMTPEYIVTKDTYGDWCVPPESQELIHSKDPARKTDGKVLATAYYYYMMQLMQKFAKIAHKTDDVQEFASLAEKVKEAFNKTYFHQETFQYSNNTITANILPLSFNMVPKGSEEKVFSNIVDKILDENNGHIGTGVIGTQWLMRGLTKFGRPDVAYRLASNTTYPSWGYMVENGATTIWELWNGNTANPGMNSQNHVMLLGDLIIWYYENLAGIKSHPDYPGFKKLTMDPSFVEGLDFVNASYQSVHGQIKSSWKNGLKSLVWDIQIPGNTTATVYIPAKSENGLTESGKYINKAEGVKFLGIKEGKAVLEIGSGTYSFTSEQ